MCPLLTHLCLNFSEWFHAYSCVKSVLCEHVLHLFSPGFYFFFFLKIVFECAGGQICCMHPSMSNLIRRRTFGI